MATYTFKTPEPCSVQIFSIADTRAEAVALAIKWLDENGVGLFEESDLLIREESK